MSKKMTGLICIMIIMLMITGCSQEQAEIVKHERLVKTQIIKEEDLKEVVSYIGFIEPKEMKQYAMKTSGILDEMNVQSGDAFEAGDVLLALDTYEYTLGTQAASEQVRLAQLDLQKALAAKEYFEKVYNDNVVLFDNGVISSYQLNEIKLQYDVKNKEYQQAAKVLSQANIDEAYKQSTLSDTALIADMDGYVVDVLSKKGELVAQGYPVVIARSKTNIINIGMTAMDVKRIELGKEASVEIDEMTYKAIVTSINMMPDQLSRTFNVELTLDEEDFFIGEAGKVEFEMGHVKGIWLDITYIMNDGVDYVYIVENGRASRRDIQLMELNGNKVRVSNLSDGDQLIISGTHILSEGYSVKVEGDSDE